MKKKLMAALTASSVAVMAAGATLAAYAEPEQEEQITDEEGTFSYGVDSKCLRIDKPEGFENWKTAGRDPNEIKEVSFLTYWDETMREVPAGEFEGFTNIERVVFGYYGITLIGENAFKGCTSLTNVGFMKATWGDSITIGNSAFEGCTSISQLDLSGTRVTEIGESAFKDCTSISQLILWKDYANNSYVEKIGKSAFQGCTGLLDFTYGATLKEIGESAFEGCINLGMIEETPNEETNNSDTIIYLHGIRHENTVGLGLETIGDRAFYGCEKLTAFEFPRDVKTIGDYAFANCASLYIAEMSNCEQLESIGNYAFFNCLSLIQVDFPGCQDYKSNFNRFTRASQKHTIGEGAFRNCSWLEGVLLSPDVGYVAPGAFYKCKNLKYIGYPVIEATPEVTNFEIKIDVEHSTQDPPNPPQNSKSAVYERSSTLLAAPGESENSESETPDESDNSETVTIYVPPEVTVFSVKTMTSAEKFDLINEYFNRLAKEKLAEVGLEYDDQIVVAYPQNRPSSPSSFSGEYNSAYFGVYIKFGTNPNKDEDLFNYCKQLYNDEYSRWEKDVEANKKWEAFVNEHPEAKDIPNQITGTAEYKNLEAIKNKSFRCLAIVHEPTSKDGEPLDTGIILPEKFSSNDADIYSITRADGTVDIVDLPVLGQVNKNGPTYYYYDFSKMEALGYNFIPNVYHGSQHQTFRSAEDVDDPKASGLYGNNTGETLIMRYPIIPLRPYDDLNPPSSSSEPSTTTSPGGNPPSGGTSNPPALPPTPNTDDPIEPDPGDSESSEPESSEPDTSDKGLSDQLHNDNDNSTPNSEPDDDNPGTGVGACFLAPIVLIGAATIVVAAKRRKMK